LIQPTEPPDSTVNAIHEEPGKGLIEEIKQRVPLGKFRNKNARGGILVESGIMAVDKQEERG
jgi:hypothetical protein